MSVVKYIDFKDHYSKKDLIESYHKILQDIGGNESDYDYIKNVKDKYLEAYVFGFIDAVDIMRRSNNAVT